MKTSIYLLGALFLLNACVKNNPDPSWLEVTEWELVANPNAQYIPGVLTHNITDAWVYVDNNLIGVFEVPFKIPILLDGTREVEIYPTVRNNGISATKKIYPFLEAYVATVNLVKNETVTVHPVTQYKANTQFWIEDFEDTSYDIVDGNSTLATMVRTGDLSVLNTDVNGNFFGRISLDETLNKYIGSTTANNNGTLVMALPIGQEVYLEIDYHTNNNLTTGVLSISSASGIIDNPYIQINAQAEVEWKKIYIDLRETVTAYPNSDYFEFSFNATLDEGETSGEINIDNIKAVYF